MMYTFKVSFHSGKKVLARTCLWIKDPSLTRFCMGILGAYKPCLRTIGQLWNRYASATGTEMSPLGISVHNDQDGGETVWLDKAIDEV